MRRALVPAIVLLSLAMDCSRTAAQESATPPLPELTGAQPIALPQYDGVVQLLVLSDRWAIVVTSNIEEVVAEIDVLSKGQLRKAANAWDKIYDDGWKDFTARNVVRGLRDRYIAEARERVGERQLDAPAAYEITSKDDARYASPRPPAHVGRMLVGVGAGRITGAQDIDYGQYSYINFPEPLEKGRTYTVAVQKKKKVTFTFDEDKTISRAIKVNQVGYLSEVPKKFAYLGCHLYGIGPMDCSMYPTFEVVNTADGSVALTGSIRLRDKNSRIAPTSKPGAEAVTPQLINGEDVYELDLSALNETGEFYIRIPGVGRSWPFRNAPDVYGEVFYTSARGLYHQRCGVAYDPAHTDWKRGICHTDPIYESENIAFAYGKFDPPKNYSYFEVIAASLDKSRKTEHVTGGWHDAADWDRRNQHYVVIFDLLNAYEIAPEKFSDGQLNLPESGNGIPDLLDEVAFGLGVWAKSMTPEGGVSGHVETVGHVTMDADADYAFSRRTRWDSLLFAAGAAQLAEHLKPFDAERSQYWAELALKAYSFGQNPANSLGKIEIPARGDRGRGPIHMLSWEEKDEYIVPFLIHAKARMYWLTGNETYLDGFKALLEVAPRPYRFPYSLLDYSPWFYFDICSRPDSFLPEVQRKALIKSHFMPIAEKLISDLDSSPYRRTWPRDQYFWMGFGASDMTNAGRTLLIAYKLTGEARFRDAAAINFDFMLGANPLGMSWTTGVGYSYPVNIQHEVSMVDNIADPVPGITIYGINGAQFRNLRDTVWQSPSAEKGEAPDVFLDPEVPLWRRWSCHPTLNVGQCEFTIQETMSSTIFCSAVLLDKGWQPSAALKARGPRPESALYGLWYLP